MAWSPYVVSAEEMGEVRGYPGPRGTEAVYASIPHRRRLLDQYAGVVFFDSDNVVMPDAPDICLEVTPDQPIGTEAACNCAVMVLLSCEKTKKMLDLIWDTRHGYAGTQWAEQAAYMDLMGFDPKYPGDNLPPVYLGDTEWTPLRANLSPGWNVHPYHPFPDPVLSIHPGGLQPFSHRLEVLKHYVAMSQLPDAVLAPWPR